MYSTSVYYYRPKVISVIYHGESTRRYQIVYAKNLTLNKGIDNKLQFQFLNQEQKPVDITGKTISFRLINTEGNTVLLQKSLALLLPLTGIATLTVLESELLEIDAQLASYSLEITEGNLNLPIFTNSEASARGTIAIVDSILPKHTPSIEVSIPSHGNVSNTGTTYYSSVIGRTGSSVTTIQTTLSEYSGNITFQGSTEVDVNYYDITSLNGYSNESATIGTTLEGYHPYIKIQFYSTAGNVSNVMVR